jgi:aconitate hydratase
VSIRIVLESVLRNCDGVKVAEAHVRELAAWQPNAPRTAEIPFVVARVVLQDFTGVPLLADLAAMRSCAERLGRDPGVIEPLVPVDLVVDHSVQIDHFGSTDALRCNMKLEFERNRERYQFMKWGMQAFDTFKVVPPGIGIVHQVNLEYLFRGVQRRRRRVFPRHLVGTDSHTTMINGIGVVGWGVGGIEAEAGDARPAGVLPDARRGRRRTDGPPARRRHRHRPGAHPDREAAAGKGGGQVRRVLRRGRRR